jgi:hypothetical protein
VFGVEVSWKNIFFVVKFNLLWDFAPLIVIAVLIDCFIMFYIVVVCSMVKLLKLLIMSVSNLLVIFWVGNGGELKFFL